MLFRSVKHPLVGKIWDANTQQWAIERDVSIIAANLSRNDARAVFTNGFASLPKIVPPDLLDRAWNTARAETLLRELTDSHCGQLPPQMAPGMANAQRARDAVMATVIALRAPQQERVALIAGAGHVRRDRGVPIYLYIQNPVARVVVIAMKEVEDGKNTAASYEERISGEAPPYDFIWFTPRAARKDPCEGMTLSGLKQPDTKQSATKTP